MFKIYQEVILRGQKTKPKYYITQENLQQMGKFNFTIILEPMLYLDKDMIGEFLENLIGKFVYDSNKSPPFKPVEENHNTEFKLEITGRFAQVTMILSGDSNFVYDNQNNTWEKEVQTPVTFWLSYYLTRYRKLIRETLGIVDILVTHNWTSTTKMTYILVPLEIDKDAPKPQFYDTLVQNDNYKVIALGTELTLEQFKELGDFHIERKLIYDDFEYRDSEGKETTEAGCMPIPNLEYPVMIKTGDEKFNQIYCISTILGWVNQGENTDPKTRRVIRKIRIMNDDDIEKEEMRAFEKEKDRLNAELAKYEKNRSTTNMKVIHGTKLKLRELEEKIREQKAEKIRRKGLKRFRPSLKF